MKFDPIIDALAGEGRSALREGLQDLQTLVSPHVPAGAAGALGMRVALHYIETYGIAGLELARVKLKQAIDLAGLIKTLL
jgi:hypothetical protein